MPSGRRISTTMSPAWSSWALGWTGRRMCPNPWPPSKKWSAETPSPVVIVGESTNVGLALKKWHQSQKVADGGSGSDDEFYRLPSWVFSALSPYVNEMGAWVDYYLKNIWPRRTESPSPVSPGSPGIYAYVAASITDNTKKFLKSKGVEIVGEKFIPLVPTDVTPQLIRLKEKGGFSPLEDVPHRPGGCPEGHG